MLFVGRRHKRVEKESMISNQYRHAQVIKWTQCDLALAVLFYYSETNWEHFRHFLIALNPPAWTALSRVWPWQSRRQQQQQQLWITRSNPFKPRIWCERTLRKATNERTIEANPNSCGLENGIFSRQRRAAAARVCRSVGWLVDFAARSIAVWLWGFLILFFSLLPSIVLVDYCAPLVIRSTFALSDRSTERKAPRTIRISTRSEKGWVQKGKKKRKTAIVGIEQLQIQYYIH